MARAHQGHDRLYKYLKIGFPWKESYKALDGKEYPYNLIKEALRRLGLTDPVLHRLLSYKILTSRSRQEIANITHMDSSTLKRKTDSALDIIQNHLSHSLSEPVIFPELDKLDISNPFR